MVVATALGAMTALTSAGAAMAQRGGVLDLVRSRGAVVCGVTPALVGFALPDAQARWNFTGIHYYGGEGFMARKAPGIASARQLSPVRR